MLCCVFVFKAYVDYMTNHSAEQYARTFPCLPGGAADKLQQARDSKSQQHTHTFPIAVA